MHKHIVMGTPLRDSGVRHIEVNDNDYDIVEVELSCDKQTKVG